MKAGVSRWARRGSAVLDAGVSSLGNLAVSILASQQLSLRDFGLLATAMLVGLILVGASRALLGDPLTLTYSGSDAAARQDASRRVAAAGLTASVLIAPVLVVIMFSVSLVAGADPRLAIGLGLVLAVIAPCLVLQELMRSIAYATARPLNSLPNTAVWTFLLIGTLVGLRLGEVSLSPVGFLAIWGATALPGAVVGMLLNRVLPRFGGLLHWWREHRGLVPRLTLDFSLTQVTAEASIVLISMVAGAADAGLLRKAQIPLAPIVILTSGILLIGQPGLVRRVSSGASLRQVRRLAYRIGGAAAAVSLLSGAALLLLPVTWMDRLLGGDWAQARSLVPFVSLYLALGALAGCQGVALRALGRLNEQVRLRLMLTPLILGVVGFAAVGGAAGAVVGLCVGVGLIVVAWAWLLRTRRSPRHRAGNRVGQVTTNA